MPMSSNNVWFALNTPPSAPTDDPSAAPLLPVAIDLATPVYDTTVSQLGAQPDAEKEPAWPVVDRD